LAHSTAPFAAEGQSFLDNFIAALTMCLGVQAGSFYRMCGGRFPIICFDVPKDTLLGTGDGCFNYCGMDKYDEIRKRAHEAQAMADQTRNPADKASWLRIAQSWMNMLPKPRQSAEQRFDAQSKDKGTGQDGSRSSH
jgi:hypothetical protein